jgi:hypothetical protein
MLTGMRIYSSDIIWRQILCDLGAVVVDTVGPTDINFDSLQINHVLSIMELKSILLQASDNGDVLYRVFKRRVNLSWLQTQIVVLLHRSGGMTASQLKSALGYAPDVTTHAVDTAIYQLRRTYGHDFILNQDGMYSIGKL